MPEASGTSAIITAVAVLASVGGAAISHGVIFSYSIAQSRASAPYVLLLFLAEGIKKKNENEHRTLARC